MIVIVICLNTFTNKKHSQKTASVEEFELR